MQDVVVDLFFFATDQFLSLGIFLFMFTTLLAHPIIG